MIIIIIILILLLLLLLLLLIIIIIIAGDMCAYVDSFKVIDLDFRTIDTLGSEIAQLQGYFCSWAFLEYRIEYVTIG